MLDIFSAVILSPSYFWAKNPEAHKVRAFFNLAGLFVALEVTDKVDGVRE